MTEQELRTRSDAYNKITHEKQFIHELYNAVTNQPVIMEAFRTGRATDLTYSDDHKGGKCIVMGSGPSLDEALPILHKWKGGIICTTSHASTLIYHGVEPTYILALDPFARWKEIDGIDWSQYKTKLITCPTVWPDLIANWPNEMILYRQDLGGKNTFYSNELKHIYSERNFIGDPDNRDFEFTAYIRTQMTLFSCSPPAQLFAAQCLKYDDIYLVGCDFAYNTDKTRFTAWFKDTGEWVKKESKYKPAEGKIVESGSNATERDIVTNNGLLATSQQLFYKKNMFSAIRLSMQNVTVVGKGAITELPVITAEEMIRKQDYKSNRLKPSDMKRRLEKYLASVGGYVLVTEADGKEAYTFIECENPEFELLDYLANMKTMYTCDTCGAGLKNNDYITPQNELASLDKTFLAAGKVITDEVLRYKDIVVKEMKSRIANIKDHNGETCPQCGQGKINANFTVDIDANMNRIRRLHNAS